MTESKWRRYARFVGPDPVADVDDEMEFHLQILIDRYIQRGYDPREARIMATKEFGNRDRAREECIEIDNARMHRRGRAEWLDTVRQDIRHGVRRLIKSPVYTLVAIFTLAIGIGPNIAIFSIIDSVLLAPLPYARPDRLVLIQETFPLPGNATGTGSVAYPNVMDWKAQSRSLDFVISSYPGNANLVGDGEPERLSIAAVDADAFRTLGVPPILGRTFAAGEDVPNGPQLAILSESFWRRRFNGDRSVIGRNLVLDGTPTAVIGVLPSPVSFPTVNTPIDAWIPLQITPNPALRGSHAFYVVGRLKDGATLERATAELTQIATRLAELYPAAQQKRSVAITPLTEAIVGNVRKPLLILLGAAAFVLLIACANAASLLLARAAARQREVAVLSALGAARGRIAQQFLVESLLLSALGATVGFALSRVAVRAIVAGAGTSLPRGAQIHFDARVVAFIVVAVVVTTILFGLVPALHATRADLQDCLRAGGRTGSGGRASGAFRNALVVGQFALSLALLAGAGLLLRTFAALISTPSGMVTDHVLTMRIPFPLGSPKYTTPDEALDKFYHPLLARLAAIPSIRHAGFINLLPLQRTGSNGNFTVTGTSYASVAEQPFAEVRVVSPGYFQALGIPILRGRDVSLADRAKTEQVVLVNEELVKKYFPNENPIGQSILFGQAGPNNPPVDIVGIVGTVRQSGLAQNPRPEVYIPTGQASGSLANMTLVVRTAGDPSAATKPIVAAIREIDAAQPVFGVQTMDDVVRGSVANQRLYLGLLGTFAAIALALAVAGIYGVMSYGVSQRTREFGIRLALGSNTSRVQRLVVWEGVRLALMGLAIGLPSAFLLSRLLGSVLYGVEPNDPLTFAAVAVLLAGVSVVASYLPARRVTLVDPIVAMRAD